MKAEHATEFRARQSATWQRSKLWLVLAVAGFVGMVAAGHVDGESSASRWALALASFGGLAFGIAMLTRIVLAHYRCPNCERSVIRVLDGVPLSPKACPHCHVPLR
jgi:hypothetical protein